MVCLGIFSVFRFLHFEVDESTALRFVVVVIFAIFAMVLIGEFIALLEFFQAFGVFRFFILFGFLHEFLEALYFAVRDFVF
jgi:hypothetical protein